MKRFGGDANKVADYIMKQYFKKYRRGAGNYRNVIHKWPDHTIRKMWVCDMVDKMYILELTEYFGFDECDNEEIEDKKIIGYFLDENIFRYAVRLCKEKKKENEIIVIHECFFNHRKNQRNVYVLNYDYSILSDEGYTDYYEWFEPKSSYKECLKQKESLITLEKYKKDNNKIFFNTEDGFWIDKIEINFISYINYADKTK